MKPQKQCADNALEINVARHLDVGSGNLGDRRFRWGPLNNDGRHRKHGKRVLMPHCRVVAALRASRARNAVVPTAVRRRLRYDFVLCREAKREILKSLTNPLTALAGRNELSGFH